MASNLTNDFGFWKSMRENDAARKEARDALPDLPGYIVGTRKGRLVWGYLESPEDRHQRRRRQWRDAAIAALLIAGIVALVAAGEVGLFGNGGL